MAYIELGVLPKNLVDASLVKRKENTQPILEGTLYKRVFFTPLLKYLEEEEGTYTFSKVHEGISKKHLGPEP